MDVKGNATPKEPGDPGTPGTPDAKPEQIQPPANLHQDRIVRGPDGSILVYSTKEPEEVFMFGLHLGSDSEIVREPTVQYVHPFERSIKEPLESGLCIFCQLILSPDPPAHAQHYPSFQLLLDSKGCDMCKVVTSSLSQGCPELQELYNNGYPPLYDRENSSTAIFVDCRKHPHHTRIVARCGAGLRFQGKYVVWSTEERLGPLAQRRIWEDYYKPNRSSPITRLNVIYEWLRECANTHEDCPKWFQNEPSPLPSRVLRVELSENSEEPYDIRLEDGNGRRLPYITLSHCWGNTESMIKTTRANLEQHKTKIRYADLPLTFQDAVLMTAYMKVLYLWIDSLCIIQGDEEDWQREASCMADIFANSLLNFAATAAPDASVGCTFQYNGPLCVATSDQTAFVRFEDHMDLDGEKEPLNARGWTFQEGLIAPRTVCFPQAQMLWKCPTKRISEDGLLDETVQATLGTDVVWNITTMLRSNDKPLLYLQWYRMMEDYSRRALSYDTDKLVALAGITKVLQEHITDTPLAGLWANDLHHGLLWRVPDFAKKTDCPGLPSWSWASRCGVVNWRPPYTEPKDSVTANELEVVTTTITWTGQHLASPISKATLEVSGRLKEARIGKVAAGHNSRSLMQPGTESEVLGYCHLDDDLPLGATVWCLEVFSTARNADPKPPRSDDHKVLILVEQSASPNTYQRVGVGIAWQISYLNDGTYSNPVRESFERTAKTTIFLI